MRIDRGTADKVFVKVEGNGTVIFHPADNTAYFAHCFRANAVTGQDQQGFIRCHRKTLSKDRRRRKFKARADLVCGFLHTR